MCKQIFNKGYSLEEKKIRNLLNYLGVLVVVLHFHSDTYTELNSVGLLNIQQIIKYQDWFLIEYLKTQYRRWEQRYIFGPSSHYKAVSST